MTFRANPMTSSDLPPEALDGLRKMIGQLPIVFALRNGGRIAIPVAEVDATGPYVMNMEVDHAFPGGPAFVFTVSKKQ